VVIDRSTNSEFNVSNYQPMIDKPVIDGGKPIKNEKDFLTEAADLCTKLKDTQTCDWKTRTAALKRI